MSGQKKILVDKFSAIQSGSRAMDIIPINRNHSNIVKFQRGAEEYRIVALYIHKIVQAITQECPTQSAGKFSHQAVNRAGMAGGEEISAEKQKEGKSTSKP